MPGAASRLTMAKIDSYVAKIKACAAKISTEFGAPGYAGYASDDAS